jgi:hypothetical protein
VNARALHENATVLRKSQGIDAMIDTAFDMIRIAISFGAAAS